MERYVFKTSDFPKVLIKEVSGSLRVRGWDRSEVRIDTDKPNAADVKQDGDDLTLVCSSGCLVRLPQESLITIGQVSGDLMVKSVENTLEINEVQGQLILKTLP